MQRKPLRFYVSADRLRAADARLLVTTITGWNSYNNETPNLESCTRWATSKKSNPNLRENAPAAADREDARSSVECITDISECDVFIQIGGGSAPERNTELGLALAERVPVFIIINPNAGPEQIYHYHPMVTIVRDEAELRIALRVFARYAKNEVDPNSLVSVDSY